MRLRSLHTVKPMWLYASWKSLVRNTRLPQSNARLLNLCLRKCNTMRTEARWPQIFLLIYDVLLLWNCNHWMWSNICFYNFLIFVLLLLFRMTFLLYTKVNSYFVETCFSGKHLAYVTGFNTLFCCPPVFIYEFVLVYIGILVYLMKRSVTKFSCVGFVFGQCEGWPKSFASRLMPFGHNILQCATLTRYYNYIRYILVLFES